MCPEFSAESWHKTQFFNTGHMTSHQDMLLLRSCSYNRTNIIVEYVSRNSSTIRTHLIAECVPQMLTHMLQPAMICVLIRGCFSTHILSLHVSWFPIKSTRHNISAQDTRLLSRTCCCWDLAPTANQDTYHYGICVTKLTENQDTYHYGICVTKLTENQDTYNYRQMLTNTL